ncbi:MAG: hypothetical protein H6Q31_1766 [Bacteroidetes bacterium]|jgi:hypothetical protein|nr:hypothetical protein [Bacteroidota bacterium]
MKGTRRFAHQVPWLRETHENSNYILLRVPIEINNSDRGETALTAAA